MESVLVLKRNFFIIAIVICSLWIISILSIFSILSKASQVKVSSSIEAQIKLNVNYDSYDQIIRFFGQLENLGLASCLNASVRDTSLDLRRLVISTENSCSLPWWKIFSSPIELEFSTPDQKSWLVSFTISESNSSYLYMYAILTLGIFGILASMFLRGLIVKERVKASLREEQLKEKYYLEARKYAHDIRSPLSVFNIVAFGLKQNDLEKYDLMSTALKKIFSLTEIFLEEIRNPNTRASSDVVEISFLEEAIREEIGQKSIEIGIARIDFFIENITAGIPLVVAVPSKIFLSRAISNILNNAIESINEHGVIKIEIDSNGREVEIRFIDNGNGISSDIAMKLGKEVVTTKINGNGFGVIDTVKGLQSIGGRLEFKSEKFGTKVSIVLPIVDPLLK